MARRSASVVNIGKNSHRTKAELKQREESEQAALSGKGMYEFPTTRNDPHAHKEWIRVRRLLNSIEKNDAIYETVINRYCELLSEVAKLKEQRDFIISTMEKIRDTFDHLEELVDVEKSVDYLIELTDSLTKLQVTLSKTDSKIDAKRSMLFGIEKENLLTVASSMRAIPKKVDKQEDELLKALKG